MHLNAAKFGRIRQRQLRVLGGSDRYFRYRFRRFKTDFFFTLTQFFGSVKTGKFGRVDEKAAGRRVTGNPVGFGQFR